MRSFHLLRQLARFHEVHAIVFQSEVSLRKETEGYKVPDNVRIYSPIDTPAAPMWFDRLPRRIGPRSQIPLASAFLAGTGRGANCWVAIT